MTWDNGAVPNGWTVRRLGEVTSVIGGGTPNAGEAANFSQTDGHPWITPADLTNYSDKYISHGRRFLTDLGLKNSSARYLPAGSVLFSSRAPVGHVAIAANPVTTNQGFRSFVPKGELDSSFLYYALKYLTPLAQSWASGTTFPELSGSKAAQLPIAYPDRASQEAIARLLDKVTDQTRIALRHLVAARLLIEQFRQSVLAAACSGELTAQWRISRGRSFVPDLNRSQSQPNDSDDLDIPTGWQTSLMDELCTKITSGSRDWTPYYGRGAGTFVMAQNVRQGSIDWSYRQAVDPPLTDSARDRSQIRMGDLLVTIVGANTGDVGPVNEDRPQHYVCQSVALMRPRSITVTPFLNLWFSSLRHGRKYLMECAYGAGRPHLSFVHLRNAPIALPSQEEQDEIIRRVAELDVLADDVEARVDKANRSLSDCASATIETAFSGRATELLPIAASAGD